MVLIDIPMTRRTATPSTSFRPNLWQNILMYTLVRWWIVPGREMESPILSDMFITVIICVCSKECFWITSVFPLYGLQSSFETVFWMHGMAWKHLHKTVKNYWNKLREVGWNVTSAYRINTRQQYVDTSKLYLWSFRSSIRIRFSLITWQYGITRHACTLRIRTDRNYLFSSFLPGGWLDFHSEQSQLCGVAAASTLPLMRLKRLWTNTTHHK